MKKIMILAVAALALAACARTYEVKTVDPPAIGFGTWTETLTRARATGNSWADTDKFSVFGTKTVSGATSTVFNGVEVAYSSANSSWSYDPQRFWDMNASNYTFYAVLPVMGAGSGGTGNILAAGDYPGTGRFTSNWIYFNNPTSNNQDILVASKYSRDATPPTTPITTAAVDLQFNHIASLVDIKVKKDKALEDAGATVQITKAQLIDIRYIGTFAVAGYDATTSKPTFTSYGWTLEETPSKCSYDPSPANTSGVLTEPLTVSSNTTYDATTGLAGTTTPAAADLFASYVLMPQNLAIDSDPNPQKIRISYTISTGTAPNVDTNTYTNVDILLKDFVKADATYANPDNKANNGTAITGWMPGTHYTYYITIGANNAISFTASVNPWDTVNGYRYLVN